MWQQSPVSTAIHVKWCTVEYCSGQTWTPNVRTLRLFQHEPEVVGPVAASHPEVSRGVIMGNLFKYFNVFIEGL